jgi:hypothetical protein
MTAARRPPAIGRETGGHIAAHDDGNTVGGVGIGCLVVVVQCAAVLAADPAESARIVVVPDGVTLTIEAGVTVAGAGVGYLGGVGTTHLVNKHVDMPWLS